jgi:gamma-glutamylcyclotransferase (GGCT)/AIG2-like uncharacterized protein YtfP
MNTNSTYAFYGSLRRGMINYRDFESSLEFLFQEIISGYQLYAMAEYPYAVKTQNPSDLVVVEVFKINNHRVEKRIHELELRVGYFYDEVDVRGHNVGIYLFKKAGTETLVKSGDWVEFFGT